MMTTLPSFATVETIRRAALPLTRLLIIAVVAGVAGGAVQPRLAAQASVPQAEFVADIRSGSGGSNPSDMRVFQSAMYFSANDGVGGDELWRLDTNGVATMVADINPGSASSSPRQLAVAGDRLYFVAGRPAEGRELWMFDGVNPPQLAADVWPGPTSDIIYMTSFGNQVVFRSNDGTGDELFAYEPTAGLRSLDIWQNDPSCNPGGANDGGCGSYPYGLTVYQGVLYFGASDEVYGTELHQYDGATVTRLTDILSGASNPQFMTGIQTATGNYLLFNANSNAFWAQELYSYNIDTRVPTLIPTGTGNSPFVGAQPSRFTSFNGRVYFESNDATFGRELWVTDGDPNNPGGTHLLSDINPGVDSSGVGNYVAFNGELFFSAFDAVNGNEIRHTDGTSVQLFMDLNPGVNGSSFHGPAALSNFLVFAAAGPSFGDQPWFTTGSAAATDIVRQADGTLIKETGGVFDDPDFTFFNGSLYVPANDGVRGNELWRMTLAARATTTTTLGSSVNPSAFGQQVTFTATVTGDSPTGSVTFVDNGTVLGTSPIVGGVAQLDVTSLGVGTHTITASYVGDADDAPSVSNPLVQEVGPAAAPTSTVLTSLPNPSDFGQTVTFTATVSGSSPTGTVTFFDGAAALNSISLAGNEAVYTTAGLGGGSHSITARYNGDGDDGPSTSNVITQVVSRLATTTTLNATPNPSRVGQMVEFDAVVSGGSGTMTFFDGAVTLGVVPFAGNTAILQISSLSAGTHTIQAVFSGDGNYLGSTSNSVVQVVEQAGTLIVIKQVVNDNGGAATPADFSMTVTGGAPSPASFPGNAAGTTVTLTPGNYSVTELNLPTYTSTQSAGCGGTIADGETKTCTIINDDRPTTLQLTKIVVNNNGGTAQPADWTLSANGQPFSTGVVVPVAPGQFTLAESGGPSGYTASSWSCVGGALAGSVVTVPANIPVQCSITNDDQPASLTLTKIVVNDNGGAATPASWTLTANALPFASGVPQVVNAGVYGLAESGGPGGYVASSWSCAGGVLAGSTLTLGPGQSASCSITNDDEQATLTVIKHVVNDNGGSRQASDFTISVAGVSPSPASFPGSEAGTIVVLAAGAYNVTESGPTSGYTVQYSADCSGTMAIGDSKTCTITNDDRPTTLTLTKFVINNSGGTAQSADWTLTANGVSFTTGVLQAVAPGDYALAESNGPSGYAAGVWQCSGGTIVGSTVTVPASTAVSCSITNDDQPAQLTLTKLVVNDNGGTATPADWQLTAGGLAFVSGVSQNVNAGVYALAESSGPAGYLAGAWVCSGGVLAGASVTLALGQQASCSITNDDQPGRLTVIKTVINDNGGGASAGDFTITVTGIAPSPASFPGSSLGTVVTLNAGAYSVSEAGPGGYAASMTADCSGNIGVGDVKTCTIVNNDLSPNTPPVAQNQPITTPEDTPIGIVLTATDVDNDPLTYAIVVGPAHGSLSGAAPAVTYTPNPGYYGPDSFTFKANDGTADSNVATISIAVTPVRADVSISIADTPDPVTVGQPLTYTVQVTNSGPAIAPATVVTIVIPAGVVLSSVPASCSGAATLTCAMGTLAVGGVQSLTVQVVPQNAGTISATASAASTAPDPVPGNNSAMAGTLVAPAQTTTVLSSSLNPSIFGQAVTFTASVTGFGPTGLVTFTDGATVLGTATLAGGSAMLTTSALTGGAHSITATYAGDTNNLPSASNLVSQVVQPAPSTTTLSSAPNPSTAGQSVTFTAVVSGIAPLAGSVTFVVDGVALGAPVPVNAGVAQLATSALTAGSHVVTADYGGDGNHTSSSSAPVTQVVGKAASSIVLVAQPMSSGPGEPVVLTATVTGFSPSGTVSFMEGPQLIGQAPIVNGIATLTTTQLKKGNRQLTASYPGDSNNLSSTSPKVRHVVK